MQQVPFEITEQRSQSSTPQTSSSSSQHGFPHRSESPGSRSPHSIASSGSDSLDGVSAAQLDERLRRLNFRGGRHEGRRIVPGQRVWDYENALAPSTPRQPLGLKVIGRSDHRSDGPHLTDFPNEILTHILSHLHPDSHSAVALVSKRFYALVITPHAWRMAFTRYFPGHNILTVKSGKNRPTFWDDESSDTVRSDARYFTRLTPLATWRSEYLLRTRLLRGLARGKPGTSSGGIGASARSNQSSKKSSAVLTYNSKLPWIVTSIHAVFSNGKKPPKAIHGAADIGLGTVSDPTSGKVEKWVSEDPFTFAQLDEVVPNLQPYGLGDGPAATPNVMDVSQPYGLIAGEGFPGGRPYFRPVNERSGRYLGQDTGVVDTYSDIPKIPELSEAICSVWIAKSSTVLATTQSVAGMLTGSTLGVVTAYALGWDSSGPKYSNGDMTARWVLSPGVPIISLKIDDNYNHKRRAGGRVWAVALNALGEVFYLTECPTSTLNRADGDDVTKNAWYAGRSAYWQLIESTRRQARPDELDKNAIRGAYSPRSPSNAMSLSKDQLAAEAREIEKFMRYKPAYFRKVCDGWDMTRRLEADFAAGDGKEAGEAIFVVSRGSEKGSPSRILRYMRSIASRRPDGVVLAGSELSATPEAAAESSIFGTGRSSSPPLAASPSPGDAAAGPGSASSTPVSATHSDANLDDWQMTNLSLRNHASSEITASGLDQCLQAVLTKSEDPLLAGGHPDGPSGMTSQTAEGFPEIPGRRARLLAIGTKGGAILLWNAREKASGGDIMPVRIIQTDSPEISCLALSALYLVHGGSDGLVQAWDPLASTLEPVRTLNARPSGRAPRHMIAMNPALRNTNHSVVGAIFLDPDPTMLRGILSFGSFLRYWSYSSAAQPVGRKRRLRHSDVHGRLSSRRLGGAVAGYIAAEAAELRREQEHRSREQVRLRNRFGVGAFGDLTEEEAIRYAQMMSEESFLLDEQRRTSASDTGSAADGGVDTASSFSESTADAATPELSVTDLRPHRPADTDDDDYELQIQRALRLSLLEGVNDAGQSPRGNSSGEYEFPIKFKTKKGKSPSSSPSTTHTAFVTSRAGKPRGTTQQGEDRLEPAAAASLRELGPGTASSSSGVGLGMVPDDFPPLGGGVRWKGKGKEARR